MKQIYLTGKHGSIIGNYALVDDEDFDRINQFKWHAFNIKGGLYAARITKYKLGKQKSILMHREVMGVTDRKIYIDHEFHNGLDNQKCNLRICSPTQNQMNSRKLCTTGYSKYKGITTNKNSFIDGSPTRWIAFISINGKNTYLGTFKTEIDAAKSYNEAALNNYGEFAQINLID